jgi:hypothetical protein
MSFLSASLSQGYTMDDFLALGNETLPWTGGGATVYKVQRGCPPPTHPTPHPPFPFLGLGEGMLGCKAARLQTIGLIFWLRLPSPPTYTARVHCCRCLPSAQSAGTRACLTTTGAQNVCVYVCL